MHLPRWYPSATRLPDGRVLTFSGLIVPGQSADRPEIFDPSTNAWTTLNVDTSDVQTDKYPFSFVLPNGEFFTMSAAMDSAVGRRSALDTSSSTIPSS